jgi:hypothetical protein
MRSAAYSPKLHERGPRIISGGLSERPMELVLKTSGQKCLVGSNPTPSAIGLTTSQGNGGSYV